MTRGADHAIVDGTLAEAADPESTAGSGRFRLELPDQDTAWQDARPLMRTLGLPTLGLAFAISLITSYAGIVLHGLGLGAAKVGALIGGEGAFALVVPLLSGALSDRLPANTAFGKRMPFVFIGAPLAAAGLVLLPFSPDYQFAGAMILVFYVGYYLYYPPYRAIYADILPKRLLARAQSSQAIFRGVGLGVAMIAGGLFLSVWQPLAFIVGAGVLGVTTLALKPVLRLQKNITPVADDDDEHAISTRDLFLNNRKLQTFVVANALWEYSLAGLKIFIVLYVTTGLGQSKLLASAMIAIVAVAYVVGAPIAGRLADHFSILTVMIWSAAIYGTVLCFCVIPTTVKPMLILLPVGALAGAILMTLPQALAFTLAPENSQGAAAGLVDFSRGIGLVLGPTLVGAAISASTHFLSATHGYAIMFPSIGVPVLLSIFLLRMLKTPATSATFDDVNR